MKLYEDKPDTSSKSEAEFFQPQFSGLLQIIRKAINNQTLRIVFRDDIKRVDDFYTTFTLPLTIRDQIFLKQKMSILNALFSLAPHLVQSQKVVYISSDKNLKRTAKLADFICKNTYQQKSETVLIKPENIQLPLNPETEIRGVAFQEYSINSTRLFIELLKYAEDYGAKIEFSERKIKNNLAANAHPAFYIQIPSPPDIHFVFIQKKIRLRMFSHNGILALIPLNHYSEQLSETAVYRFLCRYLIFDQSLLVKTTFQESLLFSDIKLLINVIKTPLPCSFKNTTVDDNYELALEKFDLAKQTGISFNDFKILFHRYGKNIDEITEIAYQNLNAERNAKKVWQDAELQFRQQHEWKN